MWIYSFRMGEERIHTVLLFSWILQEIGEIQKNYSSTNESSGTIFIMQKHALKLL